MTFGTTILSLTAIWHLLATWHFLITPARTLGRTTHERPISPVAIELFRFLGAMNVGFVLLAVLAVASVEVRLVTFIVLAVANLSQALVDLRVQKLGLARGPMFQQILIGDLMFTALNLAAIPLA